MFFAYIYYKSLSDYYHSILYYLQGTNLIKLYKYTAYVKYSN